MPADAPSTPTQASTLTKATHQRVALVVLGSAGFFAMLGWATWQSFQRDTQPLTLAAIEPTGASADADGSADVSPADNSQRPARPGIAWPTPPDAETQRDTHGSTDDLPVETQDAQGGAGASEHHHPSQTRAAELIVDGEIWTGPTFDGRPIRAVRTVTMRTTAYSPDEQSCGIWADGITASGMSVWTNGMKLAAADPSIPFGTILTVPGYNDNHPIPVLDRGGAIKGNRLDLLYPTHDIAMQWGVQELEVVVWEYVETD